ncbi:MAG: ATP-binding protein, partial [Gammaproteobacteria bacterium]
MQNTEFWRYHREGLLLVSGEGVIDAVNPAAEGIFLYPEDELLGRMIERLIPERYQNHRTLREALRFDADQQPMQDRILKGLRADGSEIDISISLVPLEATGQIVASITDMTDQSELLDNIAQQDERFTELVNTLPLAVIQLDENGQTVFVNKYADRLNVDFSDFTKVVYLEGTNLQVKKLSELVFKDHYLDGIELSSRSDDRIPVEIWLLENNAGTIIVCNEVRIRRDLEEARSAGEEGFKRMLNRLPISMLLLDRSADLKFANLHALQAGLVHGAGSSDVGQLPVSMNPGSMVPCNITEFVHESFEAAGSGGMAELDFILADGNRLPMNCWLTPFRYDERGAVTQILAILIDRTDQMLKEEADKRKLEAEASNRAKSRFLTNISHELRTPLNAVLGFQQLIGQSGQLTGDQKDNLEMANKNGVELLKVINDILELSRIESADLEINPEGFSLADLLSEVERAFTPKQSISDVKLVIKVDRTLPDRLFADYDKLRQIIFVLMDNAFKFTQKGQVSIELEKRNFNGLVIRVKDTGRGIAENLMGSLFEPFQHLDYQAEHGLGTGLGLPICQSYARAMGGEVEVRSQPGSGAEFEVILPILGDETVNSNVPVLHRESESNMPRVLVVDDSFPTREILRQLLTSEGIIYEEAGNGLEALERVREFRPEVILMDLEMPVMDGFEATR